MNRIFTLLLVLTISLSINAQKKKGNIAQKATTEMTNTLSLDAVTSAKVLVLQKEKNASFKTAKKELKGDKKALKAKKKEILNKFRSNLSSTIGEEKAIQWAKLKKSAKKEKTKKKKN